METTIRRREFLALSLAAAACASAAEPRDKFPKEPRKRLAVSSYPFRHLIASKTQSGESSAGRMTIEQFAESIPAKLNVHGIEPWSHHFESTGPDYVRTLSASFEKAGVRVVNIPVDVSVKLCGNPDDREAGLAKYRQWVDAAVILKSPSIRVHLPHGETGEEIHCSVSALSELARYGASKNIVINVENDNPDSENPERVAKVLKTVNSPFLRALPDFCNAMLVHDDPEYDYQAMRLLFPLAFNISHVKDAEVFDGHNFQVDVNRIFSIAKEAGYRGYFSMEWEGAGNDPYEGARKLIEASIRNLS